MMKVDNKRLCFVLFTKFQNILMKIVVYIVIFFPGKWITGTIKKIGKALAPVSKCSRKFKPQPALVFNTY